MITIAAADTSSAFGALVAANDALGNTERLRATLVERGYLFLRGLLEPSRVERVREDGIQAAKHFGLVNPQASAEPTWSGITLRGDEFALDGPLARRLGRARSLGELIESPALHAVLDALFGERARSWVPNRDQFKMVPPGDLTLSLGHVQLPTATPAHQDYYSFRSLDFRTVWMPLMPMPQIVGGLAVKASSHTLGLYEHWWRGSEQLGVADSAQQAAAWRDAGGRVLGGIVAGGTGDGAWLRADFEPGDALIFHPMLLHRGLINTSDQLRMSFDIRFQPRSMKSAWESRYRIAFRTRFLQQAQATIAQHELDESTAARIWQRIREEGPRQGNLSQRVAVLANELRD